MYFSTASDDAGDSRRSNRILLNARNISVCRKCLYVEGKKLNPIVDHGYEPDSLNDSNRYYIEFKEDLEPGSQLKIIFTR